MPRSQIDPEAQHVLDQIAQQAAQAPKPDPDMTESERVAGVRQAYLGAAAMAGPPENVVKIDDVAVAGSSGTIPVRVYRPTVQDRATPVLMWLHGGSFISGDLETHDAPLRAVANRAGFPVVAVAWRVAPEHPYPAGLDDADAVLQWIVGEAASEFRFDPSSIFVGGDSAGGGLAAALTIRARDRGGPAIAGQVLLYPNTDLDGDGSRYPSWHENDGLILTRSDMERNFALYVGYADAASPEISPIRVLDAAGLPPMLLITGEADPQRDEGEAYGTRLTEAGVAVDQTRYPGMIHGFMQMAGALQAARDVIDQVGTWLSRNGLAANERASCDLSEGQNHG